MDYHKEVRMMNKKGGTFSAWIELIIMAILFVGSIAIIGSSMNNYYGKNYDLTYGLQTNETQNAIVSLQEDVVNSTSSGQSSMTDFGIYKLATLPHIMLVATSLLWDFVSGSFINTLVGMMSLGEYANLVIVLIKILYWLAIAFILLKLILKVPL